MSARNPPSPSKNQPMGLRARRRTSPPRPAYIAAAGPPTRAKTASLITRSLNAITVAAVAASDIATTSAHRMGTERPS